jgi:hypothetical protein
MRYFTRTWAFDTDEDQVVTTRDSYWARIDEVAAGLSPEVLRLAREVNIHDGLVRHVWLDRTSRRLVVALRCGDLQVGYSDVDLIYDDIDVDRLDRTALRAAAEDPMTEALYDEVDLLPSSRFVHRILFGVNMRSLLPCREVEIVFRTLHVSIMPRPDRMIRDTEDKYHEVG